MKKLLLIFAALNIAANAETIIIKDCQVPKVRYNQLFYHAAEANAQTATHGRFQRHKARQTEPPRNVEGRP